MHLTQRAHQIISQCLHPGQLAVDATAGNGHDCCFLAQRVSSKGTVFAFDIQLQALQSTAARLQQLGLSKQVQLIHSGHEHMRNELPGDCQGRIQAVTFNLGYLPHGDKSITTTSSSTLPALQQACELLHPEGIITVLAYRGHPGGLEESRAVEEQLQALANPDQYLSTIESPGPVLLVLAPHRHE